MNVLLVEDDPITREALAEVLPRYGADVRTAESGQAGLAELAKRSRPDVVVLDYYLQDMDGAAVLDLMRENVRLSGLPVVFQTAAGDEAAAALHARLQQRGGVGPVRLVRKPCPPEDLMRVLREVAGAACNQRRKS